jgi:hypothetical protein
MALVENSSMKIPRLCNFQLIVFRALKGDGRSATRSLQPPVLPRNCPLALLLLLKNEGGVQKYQGERGPLIQAGRIVLDSESMDHSLWLCSTNF